MILFKLKFTQIIQDCKNETNLYSIWSKTTYSIFRSCLPNDKKQIRGISSFENTSTDKNTQLVKSFSDV